MFKIDSSCPMINDDCYTEGGCENCFMRVDNLLGEQSGTTEAGISCQKEFIMKKKIDGKWVDTDCPGYSADICSEVGCEDCSIYDNPIPDDEDDIEEECFEEFEYEDEDPDEEFEYGDDEDWDYDDYAEDEDDDYDELDDCDDEEDDDYEDSEFYVDDNCPNFSEGCWAIGCNKCSLATDKDDLM